MEEFTISAELAQKIVSYLWQESSPIGKPPAYAKDLIDEIAISQQKALEVSTSESEDA